MQDVILMSDSCDVCGYKSSEIKGGGAISDKGRLITVQVTEQEDLRRDVIKADSAVVSPLCRTSLLRHRCTPDLSCTTPVTQDVTLSQGTSVSCDAP